MSAWWFLTFFVLLFGAFLVLLTLHKTLDELAPTQRAIQDFTRDVQPEIRGLQADIAELTRGRP